MSSQNYCAEVQKIFKGEYNLDGCIDDDISGILDSLKEIDRDVSISDSDDGTKKENAKLKKKQTEKGSSTEASHLIFLVFKKLGNEDFYIKKEVKKEVTVIKAYSQYFEEDHFIEILHGSSTTSDIVSTTSDIVSTTSDIDEAVKQLTVRNVWYTYDIGVIPFIFGVAESGSKVQLCAISKYNDKYSHELKISQAFGKELDLKNEDDRITLIKYSVQMFRIMKYSVLNYGSTSSAPKYKGGYNPDGLFISMSSSSITKMVSGSSLYRLKKGKTLGELVDLYKEISDDRENNNLIQADVRDRGDREDRLQLYIKEVGYKRIPWELKELKLAIQNLLTALKWLHGKGWVHRDVRWPNLLKIPNTQDISNPDFFLKEGRFVLIDLESSAKLINGTAEWPTDILDKDYWPNFGREGRKELSKGWTVRHDLLQLRNMILLDDCKCDEKEDYFRYLTNAIIIDQDISAEKCLELLKNAPEL